MAVNDLQGLGAKNGPVVTHLWTRPNVLPPLLPWLAVLLLLVLKPNRTARAWWIWLPLGVVAGLASSATAQLETLPSELVRSLGQNYTSLAFGAAAVWLLSPHLQHPLRFAGFVKILLTCAAMTAFAHIVRADWEEGFETFAHLVFVGVCALVTVAALSLSGLVARHRYRPVGIALSSLVFVVAFWLMISMPFFLVVSVGQGIGLWLEFFTVVLSLAAVTFATLLPFLLLAYASSFYRERFKHLLRLESLTVPPPIAPAPEPAPANAPMERTTV